MKFLNRQDAGRQLAEKLGEYRHKDAVVYALPRGGVVLGYEISKALNLPLDLLIARKISHTFSPEYAVCAITEDGTLLCNEYERKTLDAEWLNQAAETEKQEAVRRRKVYLKDREHISANGKIAIVVDDGIATGLTIRVALASLRRENPRELVVAVPVAPHDIVQQLKKETDKIVVIEDSFHYLGAVGAYYEDFPQLMDQEVIDLLKAK